MPGLASPWVQSSSESAALIKAKRHQCPQDPGQGPATEDVRGPQSTRGMAQTSHHQQPSSALGRPTWFHNRPDPLPPPGLSQWPHHCVRGQSRARAQEGTVWGQRGPELPVLGNLVSCLTDARLGPCSDGWVSAAAAVHPAEVSGTEVYFQGELTVGPRPHSPPCTLPQGLPGGKEVETSLSHSPFMQFLSLKK